MTTHLYQTQRYTNIKPEEYIKLAFNTTDNLERFIALLDERHEEIDIVFVDWITHTLTLSQMYAQTWDFMLENYQTCGVTHINGVKQTLPQLNQEAENENASTTEQPKYTNKVKRLEKGPATFMEAVAIAGDDYVEYQEVTVTKNYWKCLSCGLVWSTRNNAVECAALNHVSAYPRHYGGRFVNNKHVGGREYIIKAIRKDKGENEQ